jgi:hypothetical protein
LFLPHLQKCQSCGESAGDRILPLVATSIFSIMGELNYLLPFKMVGFTWSIADCRCRIEMTFDVVLSLHLGGSSRVRLQASTTASPASCLRC